MRDFEAALKAAGDPTRTRILKLLQQGELCVCQVQAVLHLAPSTVSKHLTILKTAGLVNDRREGKWIHYRLAPESRNPHASGVLALLCGRLGRDPRILDDLKRLRIVLKVPVARLCDLIPIRPRRGSHSDPRVTARGRRPHA
ncbi:MAG TPA: metalloregulator ArsR/SmtB family transcription factor [Candidatus Polarisedimenticolia bacterium]|nr:metalloregulator ArsR/SmtB family transcription factor [Candidatus Polarisedimenticolia bacterium]